MVYVNLFQQDISISLLFHKNVHDCALSTTICTVKIKDKSKRQKPTFEKKN